MKLTQEIISLVGAQLGYVSTVSKEGIPNVGPKRSSRLYKDEYIIWNENTGKQILKDIKDGSKVAIAFVNWGRNQGYRFVGTPEVFTEGEAYENCIEFAKNNGMGTPKAAIVVKIEEVYELRSGPTAGDRIL